MKRVWLEIFSIVGGATLIATVCTVAVAQLGLKVPRALFFLSPMIAGSGALAYAVRRGEPVLEIPQNSSLEDRVIQAVHEGLSQWQPVIPPETHGTVPANPDQQRIPDSAGVAPTPMDETPSAETDFWENDFDAGTVSSFLDAASNGSRAY